MEQTTLKKKIAELRDKKGVWRTIGGRKIFIEEGQDLQTAMKESGKFKNVNNQSKTTIGDWNEFKNSIRDKEKVKELKEKGIKSLQDMRKHWIEEKTKEFTKDDAKEIPTRDAVDLVRSKIGQNVLDGWFRDANSEYKEKIETLVLENKDLRNAGLNIAYNNYKNQSGENISFNEFINKDITLYRGERGQETISKDVFKSYTPDKKIAQKFGDSISEIKIKPIDTLGSYQTTGENEYLIPINKIRK